MKPVIVDFEKLELVQPIEGTQMAFSMEGEYYMKIGGNLSVDMNTGELHYFYDISPKEEEEE